MSIKTLGILGGGQLGRMSAMAASELGIRTVIFTPEHDSPASQVSDETIVAAYDDENALQKFASAVDTIGYEFENIPVKTIKYLKTLKPVYPDENLLEIAQDRISEKSFLNKIGIETTRWNEIKILEDVERSLDNWKAKEAIIKTARFGYDGKGQRRVSSRESIAHALKDFSGQKLILEEIVSFEHEISVIVARDSKEKTISYGPMLNIHKDHILDKTIIPAPENTLNEQAILWTKCLAEELNLIGVLTIEFFATKDGKLLANEIAPRTHNSGHWSIDACKHSQFDNHVRAVCGMDIQEPQRHSDAEMINLIGKDVENLNAFEGNPNARIHLYGKADARSGRKMGHVTILKTQ